ncbi:MAG: tetratricopeptide repeat protein [Terriglobia bacterium]
MKTSSVHVTRTQRRPFWHRDGALLGALILVASLPYANSLVNGFVYDDDVQVLRNPLVRSLDHLKLIFTTSVFSYQGGAQGTTNYYRPVMTLGYLLCHEVFGFKAFGFHLANVAINTAVVCLVFFVTRRVFKDRTLAFLAAALFALHPIHTEAVDWIAAVTDLELAIFFLLAFWFFLKLGDAATERKALIQMGMILSFVLALLSKEPAATLPFLATVYEHTCREDRQQTPLRVKAGRYGALWLVLIAYLVIRARVLGLFAPVASRPDMTLGAAVLSALALTGHYIEKLIWPIHLCAAYVFPASIGVLLPRILAGLAITVVCALLMIYFWKRERRVFFGFVWFFATLAPTLNARWMPDFVFAERYLYLPSVGFCWVVCWLGLSAARRAAKAGFLWKRAVVAAACILALLMAARIVTRNQDWKNDFIFYTRTLQAAPGAVILRNDLGNYYWDRGNLAAAAAQWQAAFRIRPGAVYVLDNLGLLRLSQKRYGEAVVFFERALAATKQDESAHVGLGEAYQKMGMRGQAEGELLTAIKLAPLDVRAKISLGELYFDEAKYGEAGEEFKAAIRSLPTLRAYFGLGLTEWVQGNRVGAESAFKAAQQLDPSDSRTDFMLGLLYGATGRTRDAIREYQAGLKLDPENKLALAALAKLRHKSGARSDRVEMPTGK